VASVYYGLGSGYARLVLEKYILELRKVPTLIQSMDIPEVKEGTNEAAAVEFSQVADEEDQLAQETGLIRRRLEKVEQLSISLGQYETDLVGQEDRLQGVGWFGEKLQDTHTCPVCAAVHNDGNARLVELQTLAQEMRALTLQSTKRRQNWTANLQF